MSARSIVVAGPSGVGKSTLIRRALELNSNWVFSISATTRPMREGEQDGREYHFLSHDEFMSRIKAGELLEYAEVYGNLYGTQRSEFDRVTDLNKHLLIEVDTVGCLSIRAMRPDIPLLAILPPGLAELKRRLQGRGTETEESLALRFGNVYAELQRIRSFDYSIVNDDLDVAVQQFLLFMKVVEEGLTLPVRDKVDKILSESNQT